jgi:uncharacterized protein YkwD
MKHFLRKTAHLLAFLLVTASSLVYKPSFRVEAARLSTSSDLIAAVNSLRVANGLPPYNPHPVLMQIAQAHADYMAATGSVTHNGPSGERPFQRALNAGYPLAGDLSLGGFFSENILAGQFTPERAVQIWQGDAPHLNTMLSPNLQDIGAGVTRVGDFIYYVIDAGLASNGPIDYTPSVPVSTPSTPGISQFIVPVVSSTPDESGLVYHEVQNGQSLWAIAIAYETKIDEIRRLNNLLADAPIYPGDRLLIRKDVGPTPVNTAETTLPTIRPTVSKTLKPPSQPTATKETFQKTTQIQPVSDQSRSTGIIVGITLVAILVAGMLTWLLTNKPGR